MKSNFFKGIVAVMALGVVTLFSSCMKNDTDFKPQPRSGMFVLHAAPEVGATNIFFNGKQLGTSGFNYTGSASFSVTPDEYTVAFKSAASDSLRASFTETLIDGKSYSAIFYDTGSATKAMFFENKFDSTQSGGAFLRFLQLSPDLEKVTVKIDDAMLTANRDFADNIGDPDLAKFEHQSAAHYDFTALDQNNDTIDQIVNVNLNPDAYYTLYLSGLDSTKVAQDSSAWNLHIVRTF